MAQRLTQRDLTTACGENWLFHTVNPSGPISLKIERKDIFGQDLTETSNVTFQSLKLSSLTSGRIPFLNGNLLVDDATFTFDSSTKTLSTSNLIVGSTSILNSAALQIDSTSKGFLPPRMTTSQKNAISSPDTGLTIYDTDNGDVEFYNGSAWIGASASGVTSISGSSTGISVSPSTGAVSLSLTSFVNIPTRFAINASGASTDALATINCAGSYFYGMQLYGAIAGIGFDIHSVSISTSLTPDGNTHDAKVFDLVPVFTVTNNAKNLYNIHSRAYISGGSATTYYNGYFQKINNSGGGSLVNEYGLFVEQPALGATLNICAAFQGGVVVGSSYTGTNAPTNGMLIEGAVCIGNSTINGCAVNIGIAEASNYGQTLQICRGPANAQHAAFVRSGNKIVGLGYRPSSNNFGFGVGQPIDSNFVPNNLEIDTVNNNIGLGLSPSYKLDVGRDEANAIVRSIVSSTSPLIGGQFFVSHVRGTISTPSATQLNDILGGYTFGGYGTSDVTSACSIYAVAAENFSGSANGASLVFLVTKKTTTANIEALQLSSEGSVICGGNNGGQLTTSANDGFFYPPTCAGTPTGTPTVFSGRIAIVYDTVNEKLWAYNSTWVSTSFA